MAHFFIDEDITDLEVGARHVLTGSEGRHAATVSRLRVGETVGLGNGRGLRANVTVTATTRDTVEVTVDDVAQTPQRRPRLILAQALAKADRDERAVEAAVEVGADSVVPWQAERSVSRWDSAKAAKGAARWRAIAREASKQSLAVWVPHVEDVCTLTALLRREETTVIVLDASGTPFVDAEWEDLSNSSHDILFIVGPEGGLSEREIDECHDAGARVLRLGSQILRTSTAGPVAIAVASALMGRWGERPTIET